MSAEIVKVYREQIPGARLIGKRYTDADMAGGSFAAQWGMWVERGWFAVLEPLGALPEGGDAFVGAMHLTNGVFDYWIGMLFPKDTPVPEGFESAEFAPCDLGVCWLYGSEASGELFGMEAHNNCMAALKAAGYTPREDGWFIERYNCPRYTVPDEHGKVILDYCAVLAERK